MWKAYELALLLITTFVLIEAGASNCVAVAQTHIFYDWTCQPFGYHELTNIPYHHCSLSCFQNGQCEAFIYDTEGHACMILYKLCIWPRPHVGHIYVTKPQCVSWESPDSYHKFYWFMESTSFKCYIGRRPHRENMLVGKVTNDFYSIDPNTLSFFRGGSYEMLVVDPFCQVTWVTYDANSGQPLPSDALIGGVLSATNTPLYVVRQQANGQHFTSYYNPLNNQAWGMLDGSTKRSMAFEVMTIKRLWQC